MTTSISAQKPVVKRGNVPTGAVGLAFTVIFLAGIVIAPGGLYTVMLGGALAFAGLVISIIGIATNSGRLAGVFGIVTFVLGWVVNSVVIGRL